MLSRLGGGGEGGTGAMGAYLIVISSFRTQKIP